MILVESEASRGKYLMKYFVKTMTLQPKFSQIAAQRRHGALDKYFVKPFTLNGGLSGKKLSQILRENTSQNCHVRIWVDKSRFQV